MSKKPIQLRIDEKLLEQLQGETNLSHLFRQLASLYLGTPTGVERGMDDVAGMIIDGLDAQVYQLETKVWHKENLSKDELAEIDRLYHQALGLVHPKCSAPRNIDLVKGQLLVGRLALIRFEYSSREGVQSSAKSRTHA